MSSTRVAATPASVGARRYAYQAFISYSHAADGKLAASLQGALQRFAKPWHQRRALRVFRDTTGLTVTPDLWDAIRDALESSEYFILLASERAAQSRWVELELETWLTIASADRLLIVWTDGELAWDHDAGDFDWRRTTCLHPRLRGVFAAEPLHLDLRWARTAEDLSPRRPEFLDAVARLSSTLRDVPFDDLVGEEIRQHKRTKRLAASAITALSVLLLTSVAAAVLAVKQRNEARRRLVEMTVASGARDIERGDLSAAALWFAQALEYETRSSELALHRLRLRSALQLHPALLHVMSVDSSVQARWVAFTRDGSLLLTDGFRESADAATPRAGGPIGGLTVWQAESGDAVPLRITAAEAQQLLAVDASADGVRMVTSDAEGTAHLFDARSGAELTRFDHAGVVSAAFSRDGALLLTASADEVRVWQVADARLLHTLPHDSELAGMSFARDGRRVASITVDNRAHIWTLDDGGATTHTAIGHEDPLHAVDVSGDGRFAVTIAQGDARLWQLDTAAEPEHLQTWSGVRHAEFSPSSALLLLADVFGEATVFALHTQAVLTTVRHQHAILHATFSADGESFATASADNVARVWDAGTGEPRTPPLYHEGTVTHVAFNADRSRLATTTTEGLLRIWNLVVAPPPIRHEYAQRAEFHPDGRRLLISGDYGVKLWDAQRDTSPSFATGSQLYHAAFSPDGRRIVTASEDGVARIWDVETTTEIMALAHERRVEHASFHPTQPWLLTAGAAGHNDSEVSVWDLNSGDKLFTLPPSDQRSSHAWFNADGTRVLTLGSGASLWDVATRERIAVDSIDDTRHVAFSPDGKLFLVLHGSSSSVRVYESAHGTPIGPHIRHDNFMLDDAVFGADSRSVLVIGGGYARLWDAQRATPLTPPLRNAPGSVVTAAAVSRNGQWIATVATGEGTVRLWDARDGQALTPSLVHRDVGHAAFSPDASQLVTTGATVRVWPLDAFADQSDDRLALAARTVAARRIDDTGAVVPFDAPQFRAEWSRLRATRR